RVAPRGLEGVRSVVRPPPRSARPADARRRPFTRESRLTAPDDRGRLPVLVVSGFLGSGKTTLLRRVLQGAKMARSLVLVNEAAELGLDDRLLRTRGGQAVRLLSNGCLCCAIEDDLRQALLDA